MQCLRCLSTPCICFVPHDGGPQKRKLDLTEPAAPASEQKVSKIAPWTGDVIADLFSTVYEAMSPEVLLPQDLLRAEDEEELHARMLQGERLMETDERPHRRNEENKITQPPFRVGVATWNINHYRDKDVGNGELQKHYTDLLRAQHALGVASPRRLIEKGNADEQSALFGAEMRGRDRQALLGIFGEFVEKQKAENKPEALGLAKRMGEAQGQAQFGKILEDLKEYLRKTKQGKMIAGVKRRLAKLASAKYAEDCLAYVDRRTERVRRWIDNAERLAALDGLGLEKPALGEVKAPADHATAIEQFGAVFLDAKQAYATLRGELKRRAIPHLLADLFDKNPWLDAVVLQEVNAVEGLTKRLWTERMGTLHPIVGKLALAAGPHMIGGKGALDDKDGGKGKEEKDEEEEDDIVEDEEEEEEEDVKVRSGGRQHEYYAVVFRSDRFTAEDWFTLDTKGEVGKKTPYRWDKGKHVYRPIVVHVLKSIARNIVVHVAAVHTTPGSRPGQSADREFDRQNEFIQLKEAFAAIRKRAAEERWIVGGDYYLSNESLAEDPRKLDKATMKQRLPKERYEQGVKKQETLSYEELFELEPKGIVEALAQQQLQGAKQNLKERLLPQTKIELVRHVLRATFKKVLGKELGTAQPVSGSNWHDVELLWARRSRRDESKAMSEEEVRFHATARVADLFVFGKAHFKDWEAGLIHPTGRMVLTDSEDRLTVSSFWSMVSDHFPVGGYFSSSEDDGKLEEAIQIEGDATAALRWLERYRRAFLLHKLANGARKGLPAQQKGTWPEAVGIAALDLQDGGAFRAWLVKLDKLIVMKTVPGASRGLRIDTKLYDYKRARHQSKPRVWYDKEWYGADVFAAGDEHGYWALVDRLIDEKLPRTELTAKDYGHEGDEDDGLVKGVAEGYAQPRKLEAPFPVVASQDRPPEGQAVLQSMDMAFPPTVPVDQTWNFYPMSPNDEMGEVAPLSPIDEFNAWLFEQQ